MTHRWDLISIGNLSRNRYWGESDENAYRSALCTSTLICGDGFRLLVDPAFAGGEQMAAELFRRTGVRSAGVDAVFVTHEHGDHIAGLEHFPDARWLAAPQVAGIVNDVGQLDKEVEPVGTHLFDAVEVIHTPGHTPDHHSLRFDWKGRSVVVAGDAAVTADFWAERRGYFNSVDFDEAARSMERLAGIADIVVPGHDNYFLNEPIP